MAALFHAHSGLRYLVLLAAVVAVAYHLAAWARRRPFTRRARLPGTVFLGFLDLQILLGIALLLTRPFFPALLGHLTMMLLAAATGHTASVVNRRRPQERRSHRIALAGTLMPLLLILGGILAIGRSVV